MVRVGNNPASAEWVKHVSVIPYTYFTLRRPAGICYQFVKAPLNAFGKIRRSFDIARIITNGRGKTMIWTPQGIRNIPIRRQIPGETSIAKSNAVLRQFVKTSGLKPGVYEKGEELDYKSLVFVHTRLCEVLENEISGFELFNVCRQLCEIHESFTARYDIRAGRDAIVMHSVRSLIELAVKCCTESGAPLDDEGRDYLLALAILTVGWDNVWDQFYSGLFRQNEETGAELRRLQSG